MEAIGHAGAAIGILGTDGVVSGCPDPPVLVGTMVGAILTVSPLLKKRCSLLRRRPPPSSWNQTR